MEQILRVDAPSVEDVARVARNMRPNDFTEFSAVSFADTREALAETLVQRYGTFPGTLCIYDGNEPIAVGAMLQARPNVATLLFFATAEFPRVALGTTKFIRQRLFPMARKSGVHRIECVSIEGYHEAHRWIGVLGLEREAVLRGYGKNGETFIQFAWVQS